MERAKQQQTVAINRGLFLVHYAAAEDQAQPPKIMVCAEPASNKNISILLHPDCDEAVLWQPEAHLVVQALAPGKLAVQVIPRQEGGSVAATVNIEPLSQGQAPVAPNRTRTIAPRDRKNISILGHVSGLGDVLVGTNEWIAGPSAPSRIEGISIEWPGKPADLEIHYAVKTAKPQSSSGRQVELGTFAGTRGKAMPIVGLMFEISGPSATDLQLCVEAVFLGAPILRVVGKQVVASGPTGREPLVGLRLNLEPARDASHSQTKASGRKPNRSADRVRVFRSRPRSKQLVAL